MTGIGDLLCSCRPAPLGPSCARWCYRPEEAGYASQKLTFKLQEADVRRTQRLRSTWARTRHPARCGMESLNRYMDSPCVATAWSLPDSGSDCGRYIRSVVASVEADPDDNSLAGAS